MGSKVGQYLVFETLGRGTFGEVRLAKHAETGAEYAIKILSKSAIKANELTQNVRREIAIMKALNHRNIVNLREVLSSRSKLYIVMDLVRGGELFKQLDNPNNLELSKAHSYFIQLVDGVHYCHQRGVFHRDLKPENLLVDQDGTLKITDFGVSSMSRADLLYTACGTPYYCAPEIIRSAEEGYSGEKVDAWSCGIILYLLLTGSLPFYSEDYSALYKQIDSCQVFYPPTMQDGAKDLISKLLTKDPMLRYSLAQAKKHPWFLGTHDDRNLKNDKKKDSKKSCPPVFDHGDPPSPPPPNHSEPEPAVVHKVSGLVQAWETAASSDNTEPESSDARRHSAHADSPITRNPSSGKEQRRHSAADKVSDDAKPTEQKTNLKQGTEDGKKSSGADAGPGSTVEQKKYQRRDLSMYQTKDLSELIKDALPGKSDQRIAKVVNAFVTMDIECAEDLSFLANMLKSPRQLSDWLKENTQIPAITCMRVAQFLFL